VLLLLCAGVYFLRKHDLLAGFFFALAIASKVYPILIVVPRVARRRWRTLWFLAAAMSVLVLLGAVLPHLLPGLGLFMVMVGIPHVRCP